MRNGDITPFKDLVQGTNSIEALIKIHERKAKKAKLIGKVGSENRNIARAEKLTKSLELKTMATKRLHGDSEKY